MREKVTLVVHDWGSALGFDWSNRHREAVKGIAFMEAIVAPQGRDHWDKMGMRPALEALRSDAGEAMALQRNYFIEEILPNAIIRKLSDKEMAEYRRPFAKSGEGRRPTLTWPREIPIDGEPADVSAIAAAYADWLGTSNVPKLFLKAEPGAILTNDRLVNLVRRWPSTGATYQHHLPIGSVHGVTVELGPEPRSSSRACVDAGPFEPHAASESDRSHRGQHLWPVGS